MMAQQQRNALTQLLNRLLRFGKKIDRLCLFLPEQSDWAEKAGVEQSAFARPGDAPGMCGGWAKFVDACFTRICLLRTT
jgi:hypothetical protein